MSKEGSNSYAAAEKRLQWTYLMCPFREKVEFHSVEFFHKWRDLWETREFNNVGWIKKGWGHILSSNISGLNCWSTSHKRESKRTFQVMWGFWGADTARYKRTLLVFLNHWKQYSVGLTEMFNSIILHVLCNKGWLSNWKVAVCFCNIFRKAFIHC